MNRTNRIRFCFTTIIGTMLIGMGIGIFLTPYKIVGGGASGIATILYHLFSVPIGIGFFVINIILLLAGLKILGRGFVIKTLFCSTLVSLFSQMFSLIHISLDNLMLVSIFGGVLYGTGIGICFVAGSSSGGTDILGRIMQSKWPYMPIGKILLFIDGCIIGISLLIFKNVELCLYGIISLFVSTYTIDFVIAKLNESKIAFVILDCGEEIAQKLVSTSPRGVTAIKTKGMYTNKDNTMLFCALKENETDDFQQKIFEIDDKAFVVFAESQRIRGNGFRLYK